MDTNNINVLSQTFTAADFWAGKRFDYNKKRVADYTEKNLRYMKINEKGFLFQGNKCIGEIKKYADEVVQLQKYWFGGWQIAYINFKDCTHHRPVKSFFQKLTFNLKGK